MNILPLIFTFLIILSCLAFTFLKEVKSIFLAENALEGFHRTERVLNNAIAKTAYRKISTTAKKPNRQSKKTGPYISKRTAFPPSNSSKFNLAPLIQHTGEVHLHPLYEPLAEFLRLLYKKPIFDTEPHSDKIEYRLIEALLKKARKSPGAKTLAELYPEDPTLAKVFYKMLKGTNQYDRTQGIPPLNDFIFLDKSPASVFFCFASPPLLEALFGSEIAQTIMQEEKKKESESRNQYYFSKEDLQAMLMKNPAYASSFAVLESHLSFSKKPMKRLQIGGRDQRSKIAMEKSL